MMQNLSNKELKKDFVNTFKGDHTGNLMPRQTYDVLYSKAVPTAVREVKLLGWSEDLAKDLGVAKPTEQKDIDIYGGNYVTDSMYPYAACYAGHQFGNWAGQLGDGRAITLGELVTSSGKTWELQLKGAGKTPYSRRADGRAVLRSSVREYLMSEAMHYLGVPTTRALSLVATGDQVLRDMFYDGNPEFEQGAIVMRVAPSFLRFGNFEILAARKEVENLQKLVNWTLDRLYPHVKGENRILDWFKEVVERTAALMVEWMRVGFVHGVMNTDNMSILGLTIDYGPYSFVDDYDPDFTPNTTDLPGRRYAFGKQAAIGYWNLGCLASAIAPLLPDTKELVAVVEGYEEIYWQKYIVMQGKKLGLDEAKSDDVSLLRQLDTMLTVIKPDMTIFYQLLIDFPLDLNDKQEVIAYFEKSFYEPVTANKATVLYDFMISYTERIKNNSCTREESQQVMRQNNPRFILRNYLLHEAIEKLEIGDDSLFLKLQEAIKSPYSSKSDQFFAKRPDWATQKAGCSMLSCSS